MNIMAEAAGSVTAVHQRGGCNQESCLEAETRMRPQVVQENELFLISFSISPAVFRLRGILIRETTKQMPVPH